MSAKKVCEACNEAGSPVCLRKVFQGEGQVLVPKGGEALWKCTQIESIPNQGALPYVAGQIPEGFRPLSDGELGGAEDLPPPEEV
jgi:hypothetical protein